MEVNTENHPLYILELSGKTYSLESIANRTLQLHAKHGNTSTAMTLAGLYSPSFIDETVYALLTASNDCLDQSNVDLSAKFEKAAEIFNEAYQHQRDYLSA